MKRPTWKLLAVACNSAQCFNVAMKTLRDFVNEIHCCTGREKKTTCREYQREIAVAFTM
jgi:hypothetical protein